MTFGDSIATVLDKYMTFSGRASRSEYWWWFLFSFLVQSVADVLDYAIFASWGFRGNFLYWLVCVFFCIPNLAVLVRRLHDSNHSAWWLLCPIYNFILLFYPSDPEENKYGTLEE